MKPNNSTHTTHRGSMDGAGDSVSFGLDESSLAHIMAVLTDLYSDLPGAIIREYATNALDSHIEAGVDRPIEVTLPSSFNSVFTVKDYGVGMSRETIQKVYGQYGYSTKRHTNAQNGMLGLGSKSALTYTSQFTMTAVKDELQTSIIVTRGDDGIGRLQFLGQDIPVPGEPNGVEIQIPVKDAAEVAKKAREFFSYWDTGTVMIDGKVATCIFDEYETIQGSILLDPDILLIPHSGYYGDRSSSKIVMCNVAYPMELSGEIGNHYRVVARVGAGDVDFTPSREALMDTPVTRSTLKTLREFVNANYMKRIQEQLDKQQTPEDAIRFFSNLKVMRSHFLKWNGTTVPSYAPNVQGYKWAMTHYDSGTARKLGGTVSMIDLVDAHLIVVGAPRPSPTMKEKTAKYIKDNGITGNKSVVYFVEENPYPGWVDSKCIPYADIKAVKLPREAREKTVYSQPRSDYRLVNSIGNFQYIDELPEHDTLVWMNARTTDDAKFNAGRYFADHQEGTAVLVNVLKHKVEKFEKDHPEAVYLETFITRRGQEIIDTMSPATRWRMTTYVDAPIINLNDAVRAGDPDLIKLMEAFMAPTSTDEWLSLARMASSNGASLPEVPKPTEYNVLYSKIRERYSWIFRYNGRPSVDWMLKAWYTHQKQEELLGSMLATNDAY